MSYSKAKRLEKAYNKALKNYEELKKSGFNFTKTFERAMSYDTYIKKQLNATSRDINYYKKVSKKTELYKRAKSYTDIDTNKTMTVSQGKINARRKKVAEKKIVIPVISMSDSLREVINNIPDSVYTRHEGDTGLTAEKNELLSLANEFEEKNIPVGSSLISKVQENVELLRYQSKSDMIYSILDRIKNILGNALSKTVYASEADNMEMIGTPYESE